MPVSCRQRPDEPAELRAAQVVRGARAALLFAKVARFAVQEEEYAERFRQLGVPAEKLVVTGSIKYDGAAERTRYTARDLRRAEAISCGAHPLRHAGLARRQHARARRIDRPRLSSPACACASRICGSSSSRAIPTASRKSRGSSSNRDCRSRGGRGSTEPLPEMPPIVLLDTIGELGAAWGLADIGFTGGSLDGQRGGQSMIEPAGYGVPCVFGPHVWNFKDAAKRLVEVGGAVMVTDADTLEMEIAKLATDATYRERMGRAAWKLVQRQQGASTALWQCSTMLSGQSTPHPARLNPGLNSMPAIKREEF